MKNLLWLLASLVSVSAWGGENLINGGMDGGGGQGVLCETGGQRTLELLDLYEAKNIWGVSIPPSSDLRTEAKRISWNLRLSWDFDLNGKRVGPPPPPTEEEIDNFLKHGFEFFQGRLREIPKGSRLNLSKDMGEPILSLPSNCSYVQIIFYVDENAKEGQILVDPEYWELLSPQGKVALSLHEEKYKRLRAYGEKDSVRTRRVVGLLFGEAEFPGHIRPLYDVKDPLFCSVDSDDRGVNIYFWVVPHWADWSKRKESKLVFGSLSLGRLQDRAMLVETTANSFFRFDDWKTGYFDTAGHELWTQSALGSTMVRLGFSDPSCVLNKKKCKLTFEVLSSENKWIGGKLRCRPWRK